MIFFITTLARERESTLRFAAKIDDVESLEDLAELLLADDPAVLTGTRLGKTEDRATGAKRWTSSRFVLERSAIASYAEYNGEPITLPEAM